jgi:hypothetical protein
MRLGIRTRRRAPSRRLSSCDGRGDRSDPDCLGRVRLTGRRSRLDAGRGGRGRLHAQPRAHQVWHQVRRRAKTRSTEASRNFGFGVRAGAVPAQTPSEGPPTWSLLRHPPSLSSSSCWQSLSPHSSLGTSIPDEDEGVDEVAGTSFLWLMQNISSVPSHVKVTAAGLARHEVTVRKHIVSGHIRAAVSARASRGRHPLTADAGKRAAARRRRPLCTEQAEVRADPLRLQTCPFASSRPTAISTRLLSCASPAARSQWAGWSPSRKLYEVLKRESPAPAGLSNGGACRDRTGDLRLAERTRSSPLD